MNGGWPPAPPPVVPLDALPTRPTPSLVKVLHVITRFAGGSGGNTLVSLTGMGPQYEMWVASSPGGPLYAKAEAAGVRTVVLPRLREVISPLDDLVTLWD